VDRGKKVLVYPVLTLIAVTAFLLNFMRFHDIGFGNSYYAAAVKSMLAGCHNFFFASYDPGGFVSVDKPPIALWLQCASAEIFGFKISSLILPQALSGVACVIIIFNLVKKPFGYIAGLASAFVLATTPIFVAVSRTNELDTVLVMVMLLAAWALITAAQKGSLPLLAAAAALAGAGFNTKMAEAFLALPAFYVLYFFSSPVKTGKKLFHLGVFTVVLIAVSLSWPVAVDSVPPENRPYVGSSQYNSELDLATGYNGINRLLPRRGRGLRAESNIAITNTRTGYTRNFGGEGGDPGFARLFDRQMAGQISWLLPLAILGIFAFFAGKDRQGFKLQNPGMRGVLFWVSWALPMIIYFSITGFFHRYYLGMLAPGIAALCGIGIAGLWENLGWKGWRSFLRLYPGLTFTAIPRMDQLGRSFNSRPRPPVRGIDHHIENNESAR
jgi:4-amino-4-deoxy-L-arabinose transferase-like glycosyltransferase